MYKSTFEPILRRGHSVVLIGSSFSESGDSYRCVAVDALPKYIKDFGALTASTWANDNTDTNLEAGNRTLVQMRVRVLDDMQMKLKNPQSVMKWRTAKTAFHLPKFPSMDEASDSERDLLFMQGEFFYWEDNVPAFDFYSELALGTSRVEFTGWRFKLQGISQRGTFELLVDGWPGMK